MRACTARTTREAMRMARIAAQITANREASGFASAQGANSPFDDPSPRTEERPTAITIRNSDGCWGARRLLRPSPVVLADRPRQPSLSHITLIQWSHRGNCLLLMKVAGNFRCGTVLARTSSRSSQCGESHTNGADNKSLRITCNVKHNIDELAKTM